MKFSAILLVALVASTHAAADAAIVNEVQAQVGQILDATEILINLTKDSVNPNVKFAAEAQAASLAIVRARLSKLNGLTENDLENKIVEVKTALNDLSAVLQGGADGAGGAAAQATDPAQKAALGKISGVIGYYAISTKEAAGSVGKIVTGLEGGDKDVDSAVKDLRALKRQVVGSVGQKVDTVVSSGKIIKAGFDRNAPAAKAQAAALKIKVAFTDALAAFGTGFGMNFGK